jgi:hypothetical protein
MWVLVAVGAMLAGGILILLAAFSLGDEVDKNADRYLHEVILRKTSSP